MGHVPKRRENTFQVQLPASEMNGRPQWSLPENDEDHRETRRT